ncbi:MAG: thioredoxin domain-containing protein [Myxococcota bacterium]|nr:thioredoxin domain-containing protein [Myxococcota bacterium]
MITKLRSDFLIASILIASLLATAACNKANADKQVVEVTLPTQGFTYGSVDAPVSVVEFGSVLCPPCIELHSNDLPFLAEKYIETGRVRLRYIDIAPDSLSSLAVSLVECMAPELGFPTSFQWIGELPDSLSHKTIMETAETHVTDFSTEIAACADSLSVNPRFDAEKEAAQTLRVPGAPTFLVGILDENGHFVGWPYIGKSIDTLAAYIESAEELLGVSSSH